MIKVTDDKGNIEHDFIHVTVVYDNKPTKKYGYTTVNYYPTLIFNPNRKLPLKAVILISLKKKTTGTLEAEVPLK